MGECKEVRFRGPTLRTEHRDTAHRDTAHRDTAHRDTAHRDTETHNRTQRHRDKEHGVEGRVLEGLLSPVPCVGECNEVRYKGLGAAARMRSGREQ